jgi:hypothetical protein
VSKHDPPKVGQTFAGWTVLEVLPVPGTNNMYRSRCSGCGQTRTVHSQMLRRATIWCACRAAERQRDQLRKASSSG